MANLKIVGVCYGRSNAIMFSIKVVASFASHLCRYVRRAEFENSSDIDISKKNIQLNQKLRICFTIDEINDYSKKLVRSESGQVSFERNFLELLIEGKYDIHGKSISFRSTTAVLCSDHVEHPFKSTIKPYRFAVYLSAEIHVCCVYY